MNTIKVLIADDHPLIADGIKNTFDKQNNIEIVGIANTGKEVLSILAVEQIDIVLLDIEMPIMNGIDCAKVIVEKFPEVNIIMLSMYQEVSLIRKLIEIGVKGYMLKTIPKEDLIAVIEKVHLGEEYFSSDIVKALLLGKDSQKTIQFNEKSTLLELLTSREKEIVTFISKGMTNTEVGEKLFISPRTVDTHRTNIMKKIEVHNVAGLIRFAFQNGLS